MKSRLKAIIKSSRVIYTIYYCLGSFFLRFIGIFIKTDPGLILFVSYGGQKYDDSPRVMYEYMEQEGLFSHFHYVWAFTDPEAFPKIKHKVKIDSLQYYIAALKAGYWITNSSASRGLNFKKDATKNILFQHGMAGIKRIGIDIQNKEGTYRQSFKENFDMIFVEGRKEIDILQRAWGVEKDRFYQTGLPRNDDLIGVGKSEVEQIKEKLKLPFDKKVILYAPTFREHNRSKNKQNYLPMPFDFNQMQARLGEKYVLLITAHYEVAELLGDLPDNGFVYNAFKYPELNDLLKVADLLVSDYSSVVFDYSILERPILCYGYDYDSYVKDRGFYTDLEKLFSHGVLRTQEDLESAILTMDYETECLYTKNNIKEKYIASAGNAAEKAAKIIFSTDISLNRKRKY